MRSIKEKVPSICSEVSPETEGRDGRVEQEGNGKRLPNLPCQKNLCVFILNMLSITDIDNLTSDVCNQRIL